MSEVTKISFYGPDGDEQRKHFRELKRVQAEGRVDEAIELARTFLKLYAQNDATTSVQERLGQLYEKKSEEAEQKGSISAAKQYYEKALAFAPDDSVLHNNAAWFCERQGDFARAEELYKRSLELKPHRPIVNRNYARLLHDLDRPEEAQRYFERAAKEESDEQESKAHRKASSDVRAYANMRSMKTKRFAFRVPNSFSEKFDTDLINFADRTWSFLAAQLDHFPQKPITVVIYIGSYEPGIGARDWSIGLWDGKVRIPVEADGPLTERFTITFRHELFHAFFADITKGNAPTWLNEGLAQYFEPDRIGFTTYSQTLRRLRDGTFSPWENISDSFNNVHDRGLVSIYYGESLAAVQYLMHITSERKVSDMLKRLGDGERFDGVFQDVVEMNLTRFRRKLILYYQHLISEFS